MYWKMALLTMSFYFFLLISSVSFLSMVQAQEDSGTQPRSHGLGQENPVSLSPSAFEFFHPNSPRTPSVNIPCAEFDCAPLPMSMFSSASVEARATQVQETSQSAPRPNGARVGAGGIAGIVFGTVLIVLLAMGVYYVAVTRRTNMSRATTVRPDV